MTFGIGPAGTGKTYLAVACAVDALERDQVKRIVLTRPAVEAGERLGFLPGDLAQKVDPYLRPLYDALYDLLGFDKTAKMFERQMIEIAPLAYMRGRTLNHAFIILDEAQNTTPEQMKMFLTRIGFGSKAVVTGDTTQVDLPRGHKSGLIEAQHVLARRARHRAHALYQRGRGAASAGRAHCGGVRCAFAENRQSGGFALSARRRNEHRTDKRNRMSRAPKLTLNLQFPAAKTLPEHKALLPRATVAGWIKAALFADGELTVRFVDAEEGRTLNRTYRGKDYSTNVLTFAYAESEDDPVTGDLILCCPVVEKEAAEQGKPLDRALRASDRARHAARPGLRPRSRGRSRGNGSDRNGNPRQARLSRSLPVGVDHPHVADVRPFKTDREHLFP